MGVHRQPVGTGPPGRRRVCTCADGVCGVLHARTSRSLQAQRHNRAPGRPPSPAPAAGRSCRRSTTFTRVRGRCVSAGWCGFFRPNRASSAPSRQRQHYGRRCPDSSLWPGRRDAIHHGADAHEPGHPRENSPTELLRCALTHDRQSQAGVEHRCSSTDGSEMTREHTGMRATVTRAAPGGAHRKRQLKAGEPTKPKTSDLAVKRGPGLPRHLPTLSQLVHPLSVPHPLLPRRAHFQQVHAGVLHPVRMHQLGVR